MTEKSKNKIKRLVERHIQKLGLGVCQRFAAEVIEIFGDQLKYTKVLADSKKFV